MNSQQKLSIVLSLFVLFWVLLVYVGLEVVKYYAGIKLP